MGNVLFEYPIQLGLNKHPYFDCCYGPKVSAAVPTSLDNIMGISK